MSQDPQPPTRTERATLARRLDAWLPAPMVALALLFLIITAGVIHRVGHGHGEDHGHVSFFETELIWWSLGLLWPVFLIESAVRFVFCRAPGKWWQRCLDFLFYALIPPVRLCFRSFADSRQRWLSGLGWCVVDKHLRRGLERFFSVPMVIIALLVLPFLALEYFWGQEVRQSLGLALLLDIGTSVIWLAFAIEFTVMVTVAEKKARYCIQNWMDLAVVLIPLVDFLPLLRLLRLTRVLELQQLSRLGRLYRLRGLLLKVWRAVLVLEMIQRVFGRNLEKRIKRLKELKAAKVEELAELHKEIEDLERQLSASTKEAADSSADGAKAVTDRRDSLACASGSEASASVAEHVALPQP